MSNKIKGFAATICFAALTFLGSAVHAMPITGVFTIIDDRNPLVVVGTGTFTTDGVRVVDGYADNTTPTPITLDTSVLSAFDFTSQLSQFSDIAFADFVGDVVAIFGGAASDEIIGLAGYAQVGTSYSMTFFGPNDPDSIPFLVDLASVELTGLNGTRLVGQSGIQVVPEPSSLALLGLGLVGFGAAMRKRA